MAADTHLDETQRVYVEYQEARAAWEADRDDPFVRARFDRAQLALRENRRIWREIGEVAGGREGIGVLDNHDGPAPTLVPAQEV